MNYQCYCKIIIFGKTTLLTMQRYTLLAVLMLLLPAGLTAQVGIGILQPDSSAILHLESTERGFLPPNMTTAERDAINGGDYADGLIVYNTDDSLEQFWNGECWLPFFLEDCEDCFFDMELSDTVGTIDRVVSDSVEVDVTITQLFGNAQYTGINIVANLPPGITTSLDSGAVFAGGTDRLVIKANAFAPGGNYPIIVQAFCGSTVKSIVYLLTVEPCYEIDILNSETDYSLAPEVYAAHPSAPTNSPICVQATIDNGVIIDASDAANPAFTTGDGSGSGPSDLPTGSLLGLINKGQIFGRGGDGGTAFDLFSGNPGDGQDGGHGLNLTCKTDYLSQNGYLYGGGGGGGSAAVSGNINVLGVFDICLLLGAGGGGGAQLGEGGNQASFCGGALIQFAFYEDGTDGTGGLFAVEGQGGLLSVNQPLPIPIPLTTVSIVASAQGGDGGPIALPGQQGNLTAGLNVLVQVCVPIFGCTTIINQTVNVLGLFGFNLPDGGAGGFAVKRNGNLFPTLPDNFYQTAYTKGQIGN